MIFDYAEYLGLSVVRHHRLLWIVAELLACPLPVDEERGRWREYADGDGHVFFFLKPSEDEAAEMEEVSHSCALGRRASGSACTARQLTIAPLH
eukprot:COSAG01_NODE_15744_length_1303_cov_1.322822_1_plen_94_part_00